MANGNEGAYPGAREADRLDLKAQLDELRRRIIMLESRLVGLLAAVDTLVKQHSHD